MGRNGCIQNNQPLLYMTPVLQSRIKQEILKTHKLTFILNKLKRLTNIVLLIQHLRNVNTNQLKCSLFQLLAAGTGTCDRILVESEFDYCLQLKITYYY